ncbi:hypothetical protein J6590_043478 [Homalodisca vitripennis]|nr:hypothetical protein J6590_043478 [Homalodisca vitripennis]
MSNSRHKYPTRTVSITGLVADVYLGDAVDSGNPLSKHFETRLYRYRERTLANGRLCIGVGTAGYGHTVCPHDLWYCSRWLGVGPPPPGPESKTRLTFTAYVPTFTKSLRNKSEVTNGLWVHPCIVNLEIHHEVLHDWQDEQEQTRKRNRKRLPKRNGGMQKGTNEWEWGPGQSVNSGRSELVDYEDIDVMVRAAALRCGNIASVGSRPPRARAPPPPTDMTTNYIWARPPGYPLLPARPKIANH